MGSYGGIGRRKADHIRMLLNSNSVKSLRDVVGVETVSHAGSSPA
jgi:hypothetical protein